MGQLFCVMTYPFYKVKEINFHIALVCMNASTESEGLNGVQTPLFLQAVVIVIPRGSLFGKRLFLAQLWPCLSLWVILKHTLIHSGWP